MSQRQRIDLAEVAAQPNLDAALWSAARGKRARPDVVAFLADSARQMAGIRDALLNARLPIGTLNAFAIRDPKPRIIHAAPFADRVAHHALMRLFEPRLELALLPTSYACRPGRGVHAAIVAAQAAMQPGRWAVKLDVLHCFPAIKHALLLRLLHRRFKGSAMRLAEHIVHAHESSPGCGLPIGSLTSQHFANQYLGEIDRFANSRPECVAHVRYMDDIVLWCRDGDAARSLWQQVDAFTTSALALTFKPPVIQRCEHGLAFCGMRIGPQGIRLGTRRRRAWRARWSALQRDAAVGRVDATQWRERSDILRALTMPANSAAWQRAVMGDGAYG
jgi:hypothetical protein